MRKLFSPVGITLSFLFSYISLALYSYFKSIDYIIVIDYISLSIISLNIYPCLRKWNTKKTLSIIMISAFIISGLIIVIFGDLISGVIGGLLATSILLSVPVFVSMLAVADKIETDKKENFLKYTLKMLLVPMAIFIVINLIFSFKIENMFLIIFIYLIYTIAFMLINAVLSDFKSSKIKENLNNKIGRQVFTIIIAIIIPFLCLLLNQILDPYGMFGDFSSPWFYIVLFLNGAVLLSPNIDKPNIRLLLFLLKSAGFIYVLYFFIVFIPIMPFGLIAFVFGVGILIFVPMILLVWQGKILFDDFKYLIKYFNLPLVLITFVLGLAIIPSFMYVYVMNDRKNLYVAAQYLEAMPDEKNQEVNLEKLKRSLNNINDIYKPNNADIFDGGIWRGEVPILTNLYSKVALRDQLINQKDVLLMQKMFFGYTDFEHNLNEDFSFRQNDIRANSSTNNVKATKAETKTTFDSENNFYRTWVDLEITNANDQSNLEYVTHFKLPEGAFISDYYLDVFGEKKQGLLTDKRAAIFVYNKIVNSQKDPGLLKYIDNNKLELSIFPFGFNETRKTGFEIIHKQKLEFEIDGLKVQTEGDQILEKIETPDFALLGSEEIQKLGSQDKELEYFFVIDSSKKSDVNELKKIVKDYAKNKNLGNAKVYFTSYLTEKTDIKNLDNFKFKEQGGFNLNLAVKTIFREADINKTPVILVVSDDLEAAALPYQTPADKFPESEFYYKVDYSFKLTPYSFLENKRGVKVDHPIISDVVYYNGKTVKNNGENQFILLSEEINELCENQYMNALFLKADYLKNVYKSEKVQLDFIKKSLRANILTPENAFIVVETRSQEEELLEKQRKILNGEESLDSATRLSEPPIYLLALILFVLMIIKKIKSARKC